MNKGKTIKCIIQACKFNKICNGCSEMNTVHLKSDQRCVHSIENWKSTNPSIKKTFHKICIKDHNYDEILLICPIHYELSIKVQEMIDNLNSPFDSSEFLQGLQLYKELYRAHYECKEFFVDFLEKVFEFLKSIEKDMDNDNDETLLLLTEKTSLVLSIISFSLMKDMKMKQKMRENNDLIENLQELLFRNESKIKISVQIKALLQKILFILNNLNNIQNFDEKLTEELLNFSFRNLDHEDFDLYYHLISLIWGLSYNEKVQAELKQMKGLYFFKFFNENKEKMDLQFQELIIGFLFFVYRDEIKTWKQKGEVEDYEENEAIEIDKLLFFLEKNHHFYSSRISYMFVHNY